LEGLLHHVGLGGVVEEVRAKLGLAREKAPARNEAVRHAPPAAPPDPRKTVVERTPRPRPLADAEAAPVTAPEPVAALEPEPRAEAAAPEVEAPAPKAATSRRASAKKARAVKRGKARGKAAAREATEAASPKKARRGGASSRKRAKPRKTARAGGEAAAQDPFVAVSRLVEALRAHPRQEALISAGRQKDQLVRSLIPLYLARAVDADLEVTSGTTSRFWGELGVSYAAPNAAKALRLHGGYAQDTKKGKAITARGIQYVEEALERLREPTSR
jgi:hypothetical protein